MVRKTRGQAGPCGRPGEEAERVGRHSETPAWAGRCVRAGRRAVCGGCGSGSCAGGGEAPHSGKSAEKKEDEGKLFSAVPSAAAAGQKAVVLLGVTSEAKRLRWIRESPGSHGSGWESSQAQYSDADEWNLFIQFVSDTKT